MSQSIRIVDPVTGSPLTAKADLANCFMVIAVQIFAITITRVGPQHTGSLTECFADECLSHAVGVHLLTHATAGQVFSTETQGTGQGVPAVMTT